MSTDNDMLESLKRELQCMREIKAIDDRIFIAAIYYIEQNRQVVLDMLDTASVSDVADTVVDLVVGNCVGGKCGDV